MKNSKKIILKKEINKNTTQKLIDFLSLHTPLSKQLLKKVINHGGCWLRSHKKNKLRRVRRVTTELSIGDYVEFYYDPQIISMSALKTEIIAEEPHWGIWFKPPGMLAQGTKYGDHHSIIRQAEKIKGQAYLVHRLDREASGLMIIAYNKKSASLMSQLFKSRAIKKLYLTEVLGDFSSTYGVKGEIGQNLDDKPAKTHFEVLSSDGETTKLRIQLFTGRFRQIRRHLYLMGHPIMGDPVYGTGNKNNEGLKLVAYELEFIDPFTKRKYKCTLPKEFILF